MKTITTFLIAVFCFSSSFSQPTLDIFPNPFYDTTSFIFTLPANDTVSLIVYDRLGNLIDSVVKEEVMLQGTHTVIFVGDTLPQDVYFVLLVVDTNWIGKKLIKSNDPVVIEDYRIKELNLEIFPNPVGYNGFNVSYVLNRSAYVQFRLFDYTGKELRRFDKRFQVKGAHQQHMDTQTLIPGFYFLIANINGQIQTNKIIKL